MRKVAYGALAVVIVAIGAVVLLRSPANRDTAEAATTVDVVITRGPFRWTPATLNVDTGTTVRWKIANVPAPHTITSDGCGDSRFGDCLFDSPQLTADTSADTFEYTFDKPGIYPYYCRIHGTPGGVGQAGYVVVTDKGDTPPIPQAGTPLLIQPSINLQILSPQDGATISGDRVTVNMAADNVFLRASVAGVTDPRFGHYHLILDTTIDLTDEVPRAGSVPGVFHAATHSFVLENLAPGPHTLTVLWGFDNHYPSIIPIFKTIQFTTTAESPIRPPSTGDAGLAGD